MGRFSMRMLIVAMSVLSIFFLNTKVSQADGGTYLGGQLGVVFLNDSTITVPGIGSADLSSDTGYSLGLVLGQKFNEFRIEGELTYRANDVDKLSGPGGSLSLSGDSSSTSLMLNGFYDIKTSSSVTPYLGVGIGFSQVAIDISEPSFGKVSDDDDMVFAYQFIAGVGFSLNPKLILDLNYKYFATSDPSFSDVDGFPFDAEYTSHNIVVGLRYSF